jgi:RHS repeat-associated protein
MAGEGGEERAIVNALKNDAEKSIPQAAEHISGFTGDTAATLRGQLESTQSLESSVKDSFDGLNPQNAGKDLMQRTTSTGVQRDVQYYRFSEQELKEAGITSNGVDRIEVGKTDPVDVVSGQLVAATLDVLRQGVLPLMLRRSYASGYRSGALFGPGWASTLDIRILDQQDGIRFLGDAGQTLGYGAPEGLALGLPLFPVHGANWPLTRDGDFYQVQDPDSGLAWRFPREAEGEVRPLQEIRDRNGNSLTFLRDDAGLPVEVRHSGGYGVRVETTDTPAGARISRLRLSPGEGRAGIPLVAYAYDDAGRLVSITEPGGAPYVYEWDEEDRVCGWVDRNGHDYHYRYDESGRVVRAWGAGGYLSSDLAYDGQRRITTVTNGLGHAYKYHYDRYQQVTRIVDPLGGQTLITRDNDGRVLSSTDPLGRAAHNELDRAGLPLRVIGADGAETTFEYNASGRPVRIREPNGAVWRYDYDQAGNMVRKTDPLGAGWQYTYDARGALTSMTDPLGAVTRYTVDEAGLQVGVTDPDGAVWRMERDAFGRVIAYTNPLGQTRRQHLNRQGLPTRTENGAGNPVTYRYDPAGNLVERVDASGATTRHEYGPMNLRTATVDATGARHTFSYDSELRLTRVTGPTGLQWSYGYDAAGRLVSERDFDGRELSYRHDAAGLLRERVNGLGESIFFEYDAAGRLTRRVAGGLEYHYVFDATGQMVRAEGPDTVLEFTRDLLGRATAESLDGRTLTRDYDARGQLTRRVTPSGAVARWSFDAVGNPVALEVPGGSVGFGYDQAGRETQRTLGPAVALRRGYDASGRMQRLSLTAGQQPLQERAYTYRADGAVERVLDRLRGECAYALDPLGRATAVNAEGWTETYAYDELGNIAHASSDPGTEGRTYAGTRTLSLGDDTYDYDAAGRLLAKHRKLASGQTARWSYTWDELDRLVRVETPDHGTWAYAYDPLGRRKAKLALDGNGAVKEQTLFTYDGPRLAEQTRVEADTGVAATITWEYEPGSFVPVTQSQRRSPVAAGGAAADAGADLDDAAVEEQFRAIVADLVGTPLELVAPDGTVTALHAGGGLWGGGAPGAPSDPGPDPCPLRFPGQYFDAETGLHYNLHRYYDPATAAYLSPDPLGLLPAPNPRAYIGNPLTESDPLGLNGELGGIKPPPGANLSDAERVPYGEDPMSKLAITARKQFTDGLTSGKNVAVYLYRDEEGALRGLAIQSDLVHSERLGWSALDSKLGIPKDSIDSIYTELQPCGPIYHDCDRWLSENMEGVPVSYSFDYGPDKAGQTAGMNALKRALTQVRQGNLPKP